MNGQVHVSMKLCGAYACFGWPGSARFLSNKMRGAGVLLLGAVAFLSAALPASAAKAFGLLGVDIGNEFMKVWTGYERHVSMCYEHELARRPVQVSLVKPGMAFQISSKTG